MTDHVAEFGSENTMLGRLTHNGDVATVSLSGEFDVAAAGTFAAALAAAEDDDPRSIVVDLRGLAFLDSTGAGMLWEAQSRLAGARAFAIVRGDGPASRTLELTGLAGHLTTLDDGKGPAPPAA
jgi:anti-sigma B factor antagonist